MAKNVREGEPEDPDVCEYAATMFGIADDHNLPHLKAVALDFIIYNHAKVSPPAHMGSCLGSDRMYLDFIMYNYAKVPSAHIGSCLSSGRMSLDFIMYNHARSLPLPTWAPV
jgi:hypothetical protein